MWTAVALTTVMALAPAEGLELKNVRTTYGIFGETRKDDKILPGDVLVVAFDIEGLKVQETGLVRYAIGLELSKKDKSKPIFKREPEAYDAENSLGGTTLPVFVPVLIGTDSAAGAYTLKITVKDRAGKTEKVLDRPFEVLAPKLGFVQVRLSARDGTAVPPVAVQGQSVFVHCSLVGAKIGKDKLPNVTFEMVVLDEAGKPTVPTSFKGDIKTELKDTGGMMVFVPRPLDLNKPGKYKIVIKATDNLNKKETAEQTLNLTVLSPAG